MTIFMAEITGMADWLTKTINYEIIKEVLAGVQEVNTDAEKPPRVYFSDFNDWSLNIYMSYWVRPPDYWLYHQVNEQVNLEIMKRFEAEQIEFAFPTQTLYVKKE
jgi:MscS family membrane protein